MNTALHRTPELLKYELLERIGVGGMATVYRARDRRLGREVAVKLIHPHLRENREVAARFVSEARAVARLRHPNVVEVFDVSEATETERYLVVELVRGTTLRALLSRHTHLAPELAASIALEVAAALSHAHAFDIVHRDVKPENVLVDLSAGTSGPDAPSQQAERPKIKLTDFGIAKLLDAQGVTSTGQVLGSPAHMAPEQIEGGDVGPRADVFALGVLLYESMVGRLPFDGKNPAQVLRRVLDGTYPPPERERPTVGARWGKVLARALSRGASERYESVDAFADAIRAELTAVGIVEPRREIERFLSDQDGYANAVELSIVDALVASGERARAASDYPLAAAQFNRALAYRPNDPELVRRVTRLSRRARGVRLARIGAAGAVVLAAALAGMWGRRVTSKPRAARPSAHVVAAAPNIAPSAAPAPAPVASVTIAPAFAAHRRPVPVMREPNRDLAAKPPPSPVRSVVVDVIGPKGGYLKIDGVREDTWFGVTHSLPTGPHTFEFVPANAECCRPSPPLTQEITAGDSVEAVLLTVAFRDARLLVERSLPGTLRCRSLFGGDIKAPGESQVQMSRLSVTGLCTLAPNDSTQGPISKEVSLTAGQTTEISWP